MKKLLIGLIPLTLVGCSSAPQSQPTASPLVYNAARQVEVTQQELALTGAMQQNVVTPKSMPSFKKVVSINWSGDAATLLNSFAQARGKKFITTGVKLPLPIVINDTLKYQDIIKLIQIQIGWRASIKETDSKIILSYKNTK